MRIIQVEMRSVMLFGDRLELKTVNEGINAVRTTAGAALIDIRPKSEYAKGHVKDAINIPYNRIDLAVNRLRDKDALYYVCGDYNHRPKKYLKEFKKYGFTNIHSCGFMEDHKVKPLG